MNLEGYRTLFAAVSLCLILVAAAPTISMVLPIPRSSESFSELWILGPNHMAEGYPFLARPNETYHVFVGIGNHMGYSAYYKVYVKLRNQTGSLPDVSKSEASPLPPLYEFRAFVSDGANWEAPITFAFPETSRYENSYFINRVSINDVVFQVDSPSSWDVENGGFYYQLFFELWLYNATSQGFEFHNRFVGLWLNMTT